MDFQAVGTFTLMVLLLTIIPGPNTALILRTVPQNGRQAGIFNLAGIVSAFYLHGIFSILGLSALVLKTSQAFFVVKLLGAFYLVYLGVTSLWQAFYGKHASPKTRKREHHTHVIRNNTRLFLEGFLTNMLNPILRAHNPLVSSDDIIRSHCPSIMKFDIVFQMIDIH